MSNIDEVKNLNTNENINTKDKTTKKVETSIKPDDNKLVIGLNDKNKELFIPEKSRFLNTLVLGTKGTGKTTSVLPMFVEQDLKRKNAGVTIISSSKEMSYNLYSLAKKYKRKITFIKPSINNEVTNKFLWLQDYNYDYINENIINYKEAIKKKEVVIIDMELLKYKGDALKAIAMLLLQLRLDIQETDITQRCHHFLYVDDAYNYLKFLEDLLLFSDNYNLGITLFMQSRNQLITKNKDFTSLISNNVRNTLLLNNLTIEDYNYYKDKFFEKNNPSDFYNREFNTMLYETIDSMGVRRIGVTKFKKMLIGDWDELEAKSKRIRATLLKEKRKERELELKDKYKKSLETVSKIVETKTAPTSQVETIVTPLVEDTKNISTPSNEPKPIDMDLLSSLTGDKIKPREFNIKKYNDKKSNKNVNFNPPKTNFDIALEQKVKENAKDRKPQLDLTKDIADLGSIKIEKTATPKDNTKPIIEQKKPIEEVKTSPIEKVHKEESPKSELKQEIKTKENIKLELNINPIEVQKKKEEEAIKIQAEIDKKIQEQIMNEEKERKRLVATRIFNNYNENIDYCDEVFDFKYE